MSHNRNEESKTTFKMSSVDWAAINEKLPFERTDEAKEKRRELFKQFDPNGNGYLSLAEVSSRVTWKKSTYFSGIYYCLCWRLKIYY